MLWFAWIVSLAHAEDGWIAVDMDLLRWPDKAHVSAKVERGDAVEVLVHDGALVRIRKGTDFGWLPATNVSAIEISPLMDLPMDFGLPGRGGMPAGLSFPGMGAPPTGTPPSGAP